MSRFSKFEPRSKHEPRRTPEHERLRREFRSPHTGRLWDLDRNCHRDVPGDTPIFPTYGIGTGAEVIHSQEEEVDLDTAPLAYVQYLTAVEEHLAGQANRIRGAAGQIFDFETGQQVA